ncbi:TadE/TadG family type IV pilus assembly protein [Methylomicrobium sp. RS1]|uniref:TadE/TadG family type IV pilus assembly protein n=1 Tax=Candidatus Methylomicrobium oryzae TaxID=2802053 RepID=UPI001923B1C6|nr:TadE family protein [Methylomicrobium sp. RS1]MBL1263678.1 pilus assembly protein [Methylomicrobium sp. RS1]
MNIIRRKRQNGAETLEFMVVFGMFMMLILTVFDFGRALYVWNALTEATRRGARMAVICPTDAASQTLVKNVAVFDTFEGTLGTSPIVKDLTTDAIDIRYYNEAGAAEADPDLIKFVEVSLNDNYQFQFLIPFVSNTLIDVPAFKTTLYAESKGAVPTYPGEAKVDPTCNF